MILFYLLCSLSTIYCQSIGVELEPTTDIRVFKYPNEPKQLVKNLRWWKPERGDLACEIGIEKQKDLPGIGQWALEGKTAPLKFTEKKKFTDSVTTLMSKFVNLEARFQELFEKNLPQIMDYWNTDNQEALQQYRAPYCTLEDNGQPELKTSVMPRWKARQYSGYADQTGNLMFDDVRVWNYKTVNPTNLIYFSPQVTVDIPIQTIIPLVMHPDFDQFLNRAGGEKLEAAAIIERISRIKDRYLGKLGAKEYLLWLSYYVQAMVKRAFGAKSCSLANIKDDVLRFNVRTSFKHFHEFVDKQAPKEFKLPTGEALWNLVLKLGLGCPMGTASCETDTSQWWPFHTSLSSNEIPCERAPQHFRLGTNPTFTLKEVITALPNEDRFYALHHSLSSAPLHESPGQPAIVIEFRSISPPCNSFPTAEWVPSMMNRYFDFFEAMVTNKFHVRMDTTPCSSTSYSPILFAKESHTPLLKPTAPNVNPCTESRLLGHHDVVAKGRESNPQGWSTALTGFSFGVVLAFVIVISVYFKRKSKYTEDRTIYHEMA